MPKRMKNTREHIIDKQVAEQLQGHEITPSHGSWQRLARQLPFVDAAVHMPWYYNARNVAVVAIFIGFFSFAGGYYFSEFNKETEALSASKQLTQVPIENSNAVTNATPTTTPNSLALKTSPIDIAYNQSLKPNGLRALPVESDYSNEIVENSNDGNGSTKNNIGLKNAENPIAVNLETNTTAITADLRQMVLLTASFPTNDLEKEIGKRDLVSDEKLDEVIEPNKKRSLPIVAFKLGLGYALTANSFNAPTAVETEYLSASLFNSAPRLTLDANLGKFFMIRSGFGFESIQSSSVINGLQLYQEDQGNPGGTPVTTVEGYQNYNSNSHSMIQVPVQLGLHYELKRLQFEALGGFTYNKVISSENSTTQKMLSGDVSTNSQDLNATLNSAINPEFTFGLGFGISDKLSVFANPYYRINQGFKFGNQTFAKTGEFGGMLRLTYSL